MKKIFKITIISLLSLFSFYYTEKVVNLSKRNDPIMQRIINEEQSKNIRPVNAVINNNTMLVGQSGKNIDIETSYEKMKKIKEYNEALLEYINIKPEITKNKNLDKVIKGSVTNKKEIALVFMIDDIDKLNQIVYILDKNNTKATFFIDGKVLENDKRKIKELLNNNKVGMYSYNKVFNNVSVKYNKNFLSKIFNYSNYCLYKNKKFLNACKYFKINTIKPEIISKDLYNYLKNNKKNGLIYQIEPNYNNVKQLNSSIIYLKEKGYKILTVEDLLKE